jgi:hypothetical protein
MRALSDAARAKLLEALDGGPPGTAALAFAEAVVAQRAYALGGPPADRTVDESGVGPVAANPSASELRVVDQVIGLIAGAMGASSIPRSARELADDPALLAAFFQNLDLLPVEGGASMDRIPLLVAAALQQLAEIDPAP